MFKKNRIQQQLQIILVLVNIHWSWVNNIHFCKITDLNNGDGDDDDDDDDDQQLLAGDY